MYCINGELTQPSVRYRYLFRANHGWLVGCFGFDGPLRQYFSLSRAVSQREGERGGKDRRE